MKSIEDKVRVLPLELQREVEDFVEFLLAKRNSKKRGSAKSGKRQRHVPGFGWAGALSDLREQYTAVHLQHEISARRAMPRGSAEK